MEMRLVYRYWIYDAEGRLVKYQRRRRANSWVVAFLEVCRAFWATVDDPAVLDITNTSRIVLHDAQNTNSIVAQMDGPASDTDRGIVFGTGSTAVDMQDNALVALIAEGAGAGQFNYVAQVTSVAAIGTTQSSVSMTRQANNNSGGNITVAEVGIHMRSAISSVASAVFLAARDVLPVAEVIGNGGNMLFEYTLILSS